MQRLQLNGGGVDVLRCVLCDINEGHPEPLYPHEHFDGYIPLTPCRACWVGCHDECNPLAPWWCACDCGLKENDDG